MPVPAVLLLRILRDKLPSVFGKIEPAVAFIDTHNLKRVDALTVGEARLYVRKIIDADRQQTLVVKHGAGDLIFYPAAIPGIAAHQDAYDTPTRARTQSSLFAIAISHALKRPNHSARMPKL